MNSWLVGLFFFEQQPALQRKTSFSHNLDCQIQVKERGKEKERYMPYHSIYIRTVSSELLFSCALLHSIPSWLVLAEIKCTVNFGLPKHPINQFKAVQQSRLQEVRAYCSNIYSQTSHFHVKIQ